MSDTHEIRLPDGRRLTYAEFGDPAGPPILVCVGTPQSRLLPVSEDRMARRRGFRMIVPDRPGFGGSDPLPGRTLEDWPADAAALLDALGVGRFAVIGASGGGPYAVATGIALGERVTAVALVAPAEPADAPRHGFVPRDPAALRERGETMARIARDDPDALVEFLAPDLEASDLAKLRAERDGDPDGWAREVADLREAFRQGTDGYVEDHTIVGGPWSHLLPRLTRPTRIWQGEDDNNVPAEATRWLAARIPGAELTLLSGGHQVDDDAFADAYGWLLERTPR